MDIQLVSAMLRTFPRHMAPEVPGLLVPLTRKLAAARGSLHVHALLSVFARLAHLDAHRLVDFLAAAHLPG